MRPTAAALTLLCSASVFAAAGPLQAQETTAASPAPKATAKAPSSPAPSRPAAASPPPSATKPGSATPAAKASASPAAAGAAAAPTPQVIVVTAPPAAPAEPPANNWGAGLLGLAILGAGGYFGLRYARQRGMTVADSLKKLGVEMPQDGMAAGASVSHLRPSPPAPSLPPLPSLAELPLPQATSAPTLPVGAEPGGHGNPRLVGVSGDLAGRSFALAANGGGPFTIGREEDNALPLTGDSLVSRRHARFESSPAGFSVIDEGSSNGTFVNGQRLPVGQARPLVSGDEVQIGAARLRYEG